MRAVSAVPIGGGEMAYWIWIFNQQSLGEIDRNLLAQAVTTANFSTLCEQYGIDPVMIAPAREHFEVIAANGGVAPFFLVSYRPDGERPIMVNRWDSSGEIGAQILSQTIHAVANEQIKLHLLQTQQIFGIELQRTQIEDIGLLLAYEVARWVSFHGQGTVRGLDGVWYRLNRHQAFVPVEKSDDLESISGAAK